MQIRTILYQYIKTLIKHVFLLNFTHELLMSYRMLNRVFYFTLSLPPTFVVNLSMKKMSFVLLISRIQWYVWILPESKDLPDIFHIMEIYSYYG